MFAYSEPELKRGLNMKVTMPTDSKPLSRYKGFLRLEEEARRQLEELLAGCKPVFAALPESLQRDMVERLRPQAQRAILQALEGRIENQEELFGYDWEDALVEMEAGQTRNEAAKYLLEQLPVLNQALDQPAVIRRDQVEWLYGQTVDRIRHFTPYLAKEEKELGRWKEHCPDAFAFADRAAQKAAQTFQDRSRPDRNAPPAISDEARDLAYTASMIAARKLYLLATGTNEFYDTHKTSIGLKASAALQGAFGAKVYVRMGIGNKPAIYRPPTEHQLGNFQAMIESQMLPNLQEKICPWTAEQASAQKVDSNLLAKAYYGIIKPEVEQPAANHVHDMTFGHLGQSMNHYRLLGFREDVSPGHARIFEEFLDTSSSLHHFLEKPSVREAFKLHRANKSMVELCLNAAVADELVRIAQKWRPEAVSHHPQAVAQARSALPHLIQDLGAYHDALMQGDYISARKRNHFKERVMQEHLASVTPKERARIESYYKPVAVAVVSKDEDSTEPVPPNWKAQRSYRDPVTRAEFIDYTIDMGQERAIICLMKGASPRTAEAAVKKLLDLNQPPRINDPATRIKGVRVSELSYNELAASCLRPNSIARMQFYTSFSASETLNILRGSAEEPTVENIIEALKPCFILRYSDTYCRVKPAEMVRVKYRTPTGEKKNPCWDASQVLGGLKEPIKDARMRERLSNPNRGLIVIEGEKKAALLAQMVLERDLPYHVLALPGVWMGLVRGKLVEELEQFRMRDAAGNRRNCFIFFDNDKAFKAGVTHAMIDTATALQRAGGNVFIPNLPFGKKIKGADDFAVAHCRRGNDIDYQPLVDILENATHVPEKPRKVKYPTPAEERNISRYLEEAEQVHELQNDLMNSEKPANAPELRKLFLLQAPHQMQLKTEREAGAYFDNLDENERTSVLTVVLRDNPALKQLKRACSQIPSFEGGPTPGTLTNGFVAEHGPLILTPELFAVG